MHVDLLCGNISKKNRASFTPEFRQEAAQLVINQGYSIRKAAEVMGVGESTN